MQAASRESLQVTEAKFTEVAAGLDAATLGALADELASVARLLVREVVLRKSLSAPVAESLFAGKIGTPALDLVKTAAAQRWSSRRDLTETLNRLARLTVLVDAERAGRLESVEDELFRFGRTLEANPRLAGFLGDATTPADGRVALLDTVTGGKVAPHTARLLEQAVRWPHSSHFAAVVDGLAEQAASRRGESVAHVVAAAPLSGEQHNRLGGVLSRIYGRTISVQLDIDPEVLGGLRITVGDEVIDGTVASRLAAAASQLPR